MVNFRTSKSRSKKSNGGRNNSGRSGNRPGGNNRGRQSSKVGVGYITILEDYQEFDSGSSAPGGQGFIEFTDGEHQGQVFKVALWQGDRSAASGSMRNHEGELRISIMFPKSKGKAVYSFMIFAEGDEGELIYSGALYAHDELEGVFKGKVFEADAEEEDEGRSKRGRSTGKRHATAEKRRRAEPEPDEYDEDEDEEDDYEEEDEDEEEEEEPAPRRRSAPAKSKSRRTPPPPEDEEEEDDDLDDEDEDDEEEEEEEPTPPPKSKGTTKIPLKLGKKTRLSTPGR